MQKTTLLVIHSHAVVANLLNQSLNEDPRFHVTTLCTDNDLGIDLFENGSYDIVILDIDAEPVPYMKVIKWIKGFNPATRIVCMSSKSFNPDRSGQVMLAGASAYLNRKAGIKDLKKALVSVQNGLLFFQSEKIVPHAEMKRSPNSPSLN